MKASRTLLLVAAASSAAFALATPARAQDATGASARGIGLGATAMLTTLSGLNFVYDGGRWHADALFAAAGGNNNTAFGIGARGFFHLHSTAVSDFGIGGGVGFAHNEVSGLRDGDVVSIEAGFKIRAFIVPNVALSGFGGLAILTGDADGFRMTGQLLGGLGFTYFFQ